MIRMNALVAGRLNGPSRICDVGLQDGDIITAIVREPGPVMESYRKVAVVARHGKICWRIIITSFFLTVQGRFAIMETPVNISID